MPKQNIMDKVASTPRPRSPWRWLWVSLLVVLLLPLVAYGGFVLYVMYGVELPEDATNGFAGKSRANVSVGGTTESAKPQAATDNDVAKTPAETRDEKYRKDIVGTWKRFDDGRRRLTINSDGTAELVYEPEGANYFLLGTSKLTVQIEWTVDDGYADFHSKSGMPKLSFKIAIKKEGVRKRRRIVELTDKTFTLANDAKDRVSEWTRIK